MNHDNHDNHDDPLCLVFIPALVTLLLRIEREKGSPLTEAEVISIRDNAACITLRSSQAMAMEERRGYPDIVAEDAWNDWQRARQMLAAS